MFRVPVALAVAAAVVVSAQPVWAHARLVSATPGDGQTASAVRSVSLTFSERFAAPFSSIELEDAHGRAIPLRSSVSSDGKTLSGRLETPLPAGVYRVTWAIAASDGHRMTGSYTFTAR
ncbi:copper resistance protein CopC [Brevundimonas abyssalis]|uniref:copper resistance protein CopC n=1 Tax=Brevundimonas abyssalis TaxID=1125965 RepID=UPI0005ECFB72|nr:copper resistance protein CopC [Brevundimonas abyssalis]